MNNTTNSVTLREGINNMVLVGKLKSKEVKYGTAQADGTPTISLTLKVLTEEKVDETTSRLHENTVRFWAKQTSKLYSSYSTAANEYKSIDQHGEDNADVIRITGSFEMNEYVKDGQLKTGNSLRGVFVNRVQDPTVAVQEVGAEAECVIVGITDEISDNAPSGRKKVVLMNVGYNSRIHEFQDVYVEKDLANDFARMYKIGDTAKFIFKVNRYAVAKKEEENQATMAANTTLGFGSGLSNTFGGITNDYVNDVIIIGGTPAYAMGVGYTAEQIAEIKKLRELATNEKLNAAPSTPPLTQQTGFGSASGFGSGFDPAPTNSTTSTMTDDMPF